FNTAPVADSQRSLTRCSERARARIAKGNGFTTCFACRRTPAQGPQPGKHRHVNTENSDIEMPTSQPGMAERAIDTATDVSRTITEVSATLKAAVDRLSETVANARQPGKPLSTVSAITREAPLASLFVAFLFGIAVARRR